MHTDRVSKLVGGGMPPVAAPTVTPVLAADANNGERRRWCERCHVVADDQRRPTGEVPPFDQIANRGDFNAARIAVFLLHPHPKMPDMSLTIGEAGDLAGYIGSLAE
jgi:hypothetical protein